MKLFKEINDLNSINTDLLRLILIRVLFNSINFDLINNEVVSRTFFPWIEFLYSKKRVLSISLEKFETLLNSSCTLEKYYEEIKILSEYDSEYLIEEHSLFNGEVGDKYIEEFVEKGVDVYVYDLPGEVRVNKWVDTKYETI